MSLGFVLGCTVIVQLYVLRRLRFDWLTVAIVLGGTALYVDYLSYTSLTERNYDGSSHVEYIQAIAVQHRLPDVYGCGPCGHPPAYYALAATWGALWAPVSWLPRELTLQWLSLLLFSAFVVLALLVLRSGGVGRAALRLGAALVVFWPSSVINSVRVHNDALASVAMLGAIYFMAEWDRRGHRREFGIALLLSVLALFTKSSAYPVGALLLGLALLRSFSAAHRPQALRFVAVALSVLGAAAVAAVAFRESRVPTTLCQKVLGLACDGRYVPIVPDTPLRFVLFDPIDFLRGLASPAMQSERDLFLNRVAKSSLFGVMPLGDELGTIRQQLLAPSMGGLLLLMVAVCLTALPLVRRKWVAGYRVYVAAPVILLAFLVAFRARAPNEFHEDFRHIFAALVPFCLAYVRVLERARRSSKWLWRGGTAIALAMAASSVAFFVRLPDFGATPSTTSGAASPQGADQR